MAAALPAISVAELEGVQVIAAEVVLVLEAPLAVPKVIVIVAAPVCFIVDGVAEPVAP